MKITFSTLLLAFAATGCSAQCSYNPNNFIENTRIPTNCSVNTPSNCPRSWKAGVTDGRSTDLPLIDTQFVICHEGFTRCGYVPIDPRTGRVLGNSGVTIGAGVDLGSKDRDYFRTIGVTSTALISELEPYFGLTRDEAACAILERSLQITEAEALDLTERAKNQVANSVEVQYNRDKTSDALPFRSLPRGIRTAIADVWFQFGSSNAFPKFWAYVTRNDWKGAVNELRNFYSNPAQQARGDLIRRNNEADIIEAAIASCNRSIDAVFLLDESGSISSTNFANAKAFVTSIINAFPEDTIGGRNGTRFGLSAFSSSYRSVFFLSSYSTKSQYFTAVSSVAKVGGGTNLGSALNQILPVQFTESKGLRPETDGLPRILIVLTDGRSGDSVAIPANNIHNQNIVVYAIGIGRYDLSQLNQVASSPSHIKVLGSFLDLNDFAATLTASTCNEPQPISLRIKISGTVKKDSFQYYKYEIPDAGSNLKVELTDTQGKTLMYASHDNPHPYKYDNTFGFDSSASSRKTIVISPRSPSGSKSSTKRQTTSNDQFVYISVTADTDIASYVLEGTTCNITECSEGISRGTTLQSRGTTLQMSSFIAFIAMIMFTFFVLNY